MRLQNRGQLIRRQREHAGLTQTELAKLVGVSRANVSQWENGHHKMTFPHAYSLHELLDIPLDDLIDRDDVPVRWRRLYVQEPRAPGYLHPDEYSDEAQDIAYMWDRLADDDPVKQLVLRVLEKAHKGARRASRKTP